MARRFERKRKREDEDCSARKAAQSAWEESETRRLEMLRAAETEPAHSTAYLWALSIGLIRPAGAPQLP
jgi:hypothetical protein